MAEEKITFGARVKHAWNAFRNRSPTEETIVYPEAGTITSYHPDRVRLRTSNERSIIVANFNRIALDVASIPIRHVRVNENDQYVETIPSRFNYVLSEETNIDQTPNMFIHDLVLSMFDEGVVAVVPVDTSLDPTETGSYDIHSLRTAKILEWSPKRVRVRCYNDRTGQHEDIWLPKSMVAIIENPLFSVMNEPNSTLKRLIRKLNLLDSIDEQSGSGKLDLIIQLPYIAKSKARQEQAEERRKKVEEQLAGSKYGIAYIDGSEHITQLNRPAENNLMTQIQYLTSMLYSQLGISEEVFLGTADEAAMLNYENRTVILILSVIISEFKRKFLTKTARTQMQTVKFFREVFKYVPADGLANVADKFTRNEILSSNEMRAIIGIKPSNDPKADELRNKNINAPTEDELNSEKDSMEGEKK